MLKYGEPPYLECSTKGDKRFSPFCARIESRRAMTIESIYQGAKIFADGTTGSLGETLKAEKLSIKKSYKYYTPHCGTSTLQRIYTY